MSEVELVLYQAELRDAEIIRAHYDKVNVGIHAEGGSIDWPFPYPLERVENDTRNGRLFYIKSLGRGVVTATVCLDVQTTLHPPEVWPEGIEDKELRRRIIRAELPTPDILLTDPDIPKLSVSRLAAARDARGSGATILRIAEQWSARQGCVAAVLNCSTDNDGLRTFYENQGYKPFGRVVYASPRTTDAEGRPLRVDTTRFKKVL